MDAYLTRVGVFSYRQPDGSVRREYRPPEEVFHADALESFAMVPVTDDHPPEAVTAANARQYAIGWTGENVRRDGDHVAATIMLADVDAIRKVDAGKQEVSNGYEVEIDETPGVSPEGERYDVVQRQIRGNHTALVERGRAGPSARLRMDADIAVQISDVDEGVDNQAPARRFDKGEPMAVKIRIDGVDFEVSEQAAQAIARKDEEHAASLKTEKTRADEAEAKVAKLEGERDSEKARADKAEAEAKRADERRSDEVKARVQLEAKAGQILGERKDDEKPIAEMTDREIKVAVVEKVDGVKVDGEKVDAYVDARFDSAVERAETAADSRQSVRVAARDSVDRREDTVESLRSENVVNQNRNAWKQQAGEG